VAVDVRDGLAAMIGTVSRLLASLMLLPILLAGCVSPVPGGSVRSDTTGPSSTASAAVSDARVSTSVEQTIAYFDATAGGSVAAQQAELHRLLSSGQTAVQDKCPAATSTISFDPVYAQLAAAPDWRPSGGTLPGEVYSLPTLIRIYSGDRVTGTDLTDLHLSLYSGRVWLPALCLN
jgi:hypothetical protein